MCCMRRRTLSFEYEVKLAIEMHIRLGVPDRASHASTVPFSTTRNAVRIGSAGGSWSNTAFTTEDTWTSSPSAVARRMVWRIH
jgi:hypothetical protein